VHSHAQGNNRGPLMVAPASSYRSGCPHLSVNDVTRTAEPIFIPHERPARGHPKLEGIASSTSSMRGVLRAHGGRMAEENRCRSPVSGSIHLSLTRGATTGTEPALVSTPRGACVPLRMTQAMPVHVTLVGEAGDVGIDLGLQRLGQHPAGTLTHDLVDQRRALGVAESYLDGHHRGALCAVLPLLNEFDQVLRKSGAHPWFPCEGGWRFLGRRHVVVGRQLSIGVLRADVERVG